MRSKNGAVILGNQVTELLGKMLVEIHLASIERLADKLLRGKKCQKYDFRTAASRIYLFVQYLHVHMTSDLRIERFKFVFIVTVSPGSQGQAVSVHINCAALILYQLTSLY